MLSFWNPRPSDLSQGTCCIQKCIVDKIVHGRELSQCILSVFSNFYKEQCSPGSLWTVYALRDQVVKAVRPQIAHFLLLLLNCRDLDYSASLLVSFSRLHSSLLVSCKLHPSVLSFRPNPFTWVACAQNKQHYQVRNLRHFWPCFNGECSETQIKASGKSDKITLSGL